MVMPCGVTMFLLGLVLVVLLSIFFMFTAMYTYSPGVHWESAAITKRQHGSGSSSVYLPLFILSCLALPLARSEVKNTGVNSDRTPRGTWVFFNGHSNFRGTAVLHIYASGATQSACTLPGVFKLASSLRAIHAVSPCLPRRGRADLFCWSGEDIVPPPAWLAAGG